MHAASFHLWLIRLGHTAWKPSHGGRLRTEGIKTFFPPSTFPPPPHPHRLVLSGTFHDHMTEATSFSRVLPWRLPPAWMRALVQSRVLKGTDPGKRQGVRGGGRGRGGRLLIFLFSTSPIWDMKVALPRFPATCALFGQLAHGQTFNNMICVRWAPRPVYPEPLCQRVKIYILKVNKSQSHVNKSDTFLVSVARGAGRQPGWCSGTASLLKLALVTRYDDKVLENTSLWHVADFKAQHLLRLQ